MAHVCPGELCETVVDDKYLACPAHWRMVPKDLQQRVYAAWDGLRFRGDPSALSAYRAAKEEAIGHMEALG